MLERERGIGLQNRAESRVRLGIESPPEGVNPEEQSKKIRAGVLAIDGIDPICPLDAVSEVPMNDMENPTKETVMNALTPVIDPELGFSIIELGLIYDVRTDGGRVEVDMTFTSMGCPQGDLLYDMVKKGVSAVAGVDETVVNIVWDPPWSGDRVDPEIRFALGLY